MEFLVLESVINIFVKNKKVYFLENYNFFKHLQFYINNQAKFTININCGNFKYN